MEQGHWNQISVSSCAPFDLNSASSLSSKVVAFNPRILPAVGNED